MSLTVFLFFLCLVLVGVIAWGVSRASTTPNPATLTALLGVGVAIVLALAGLVFLASQAREYKARLRAAADAKASAAARTRTPTDPATVGDHLYGQMVYPDAGKGPYGFEGVIYPRARTAGAMFARFVWFTNREEWSLSRPPVATTTTDPRGEGHAFSATFLNGVCAGRIEAFLPKGRRGGLATRTNG